MKYLALSFPLLDDGDLDWIEQVRKRYDRNFKLVKPHFTLVFEHEDNTPDRLIDHVADVISNQKRINFVLRSARVVPGVDHDCWFLFLVPDEGFSHILKLHDQLYTEFLKEEWRHDIPYTPHMTVGHLETAEQAQMVADELNKLDFEIKGYLDGVEICLYEKDEISSIVKLPFDV